MISTTLETVTPEKASHWLSKSNNPRPLSSSHVQDFARHINNRTFELTHQGIALDQKGNLVDGQHRLSAIVATGKEVEMFVTRGLNDAALMMVDRGNRRNNAVILRCDRRVADIITLATRICSSHSRPLETDLKKTKEAFEDDSMLLITQCGTSKPKLATAPVRLGAVLNMTNDPDWVVNQYRHLILGEFDQQVTAMQWLYRRLVNSPARMGWADALVYSFRAFTKSNANMKSLTVKDVGIYLEQMRATVRARAKLKSVE